MKEFLSTISSIGYVTLPILVIGGGIWFIGSFPIKDYDCGDFYSQAAAQEFFRDTEVEYGRVDFYNLDEDKDGIACESYKY